MTESATISSLFPVAKPPWAGAPRKQADSVPPLENRRLGRPPPAAAPESWTDAFPKPLISAGNQVAAQEAGRGGETPPGGSAASGGADATEKLTEEEKRKVQELQRRDREVRAHEQAHKTVRGPDGRSYAVSGEVKIDTSPVPNNPDATIRKMQIVKRAALAPSNPSAKDHQVAAEAEAKIQKARQEKREKELEEREKADAGQDAGLAPPTPPGSAPGTLFNFVA